jgi:Xaa-Pro aminopeptidase
LAEGEAEAKRAATLAAAGGRGFDGVVATMPATVRWLLCGRGRPVDAAAPEAAYAVVLGPDAPVVLAPDIEAPRVAAEERFEELGYEVVAFPWHEGPERALAGVEAGNAATDAELEDVLRPHRMTLAEPERERYRVAGAACAEAVAAVIARLHPEMRELDAAGELARETHARGFVAPVVLVAGGERQAVHRHPLPTDAPLGRHALLAVTAERDGLHVSLTRLVSFGRAPAELASLSRSAAAVDAALLAASRPGATLGEAFEAGARAYADEGFPEEWRRHHQGGVTGYRGREVFAVPGERTTLPDSCAMAWNPSITGGAKSEDTALVGPNGLEVVTRTRELPELEVEGIPRPGIVELE